MKLQVFGLILVMSLVLCSSCATQSIAEDIAPFDGPSAKEALATAAEHYKKRGEIEEARKAVKALAAARNPQTRNFEVEWTFAQYSYFLGSRDEISESEAEKVLKSGLTAARIARRMEPKKPDGFFWYAAILGEQSKRSPVTVGVVSIDDIKEAMNKVIELDPNYQGASAYDGLGQLEMGTRGIGGGSVDKALEYYLKALELNKENSYIRLHLGECYLALGKKAEAKKHLNYVLEMTPDPDFLPEHEETVRDAKKLLATKF